MNNDIVIIGAGGHAVSVTNIALSCGFNVVLYVDDQKSGEQIIGKPVVSNKKFISEGPHKNLCLALGDNSIREAIYKEYSEILPSIKFPTLIHSSSIIGINTEIGEGTVVMPLANIGPNSKIDSFCIINSAASIDHDSSMKSFSSLAPGSILGGNVNVGKRSAISIGAIIKNNVNIGSDVVIGANSYVNVPIEDNILAMGTPCRKISNRRKGEKYLD